MTCAPQAVTHPSTNRAWRSVTLLIETSAVPLGQTYVCMYVNNYDGWLAVDEVIIIIIIIIIYLRAQAATDPEKSYSNEKEIPQLVSLVAKI